MYSSSYESIRVRQTRFYTKIYLLNTYSSIDLINLTDNNYRSLYLILKPKFFDYKLV